MAALVSCANRTQGFRKIRNLPSLIVPTRNFFFNRLPTTRTPPVTSRFAGFEEPEPGGQGALNRSCLEPSVRAGIRPHRLHYAQLRFPGRGRYCNLLVTAAEPALRGDRIYIVIVYV